MTLRAPGHIPCPSCHEYHDECVRLLEENSAVKRENQILHQTNEKLQAEMSEVHKALEKKTNPAFEEAATECADGTGWGKHYARKIRAKAKKVTG